MNTIINKTTEIFDMDYVHNNYRERALNIYFCKKDANPLHPEQWSLYNTHIRSQLASDKISDADLYAWFKENDADVGCATHKEYARLFVFIDVEGFPHLCNCKDGTLHVQDYDAKTLSKARWNTFITDTIAFNKYLKEDDDADSMTIEEIAEDVASMASIMQKTRDSMQSC